MQTAQKQSESRTGRTVLQIPITETERRTLKHQAIDEGVTLGEIVRKRLGFPPTVQADEGAAV
jgi:hypothetical protein